MSVEEAIISEWCDQLRFAWLIARGERLGELRGKRAKLMDERGLHPYSQLVGYIESLQGLVPELREAGFDPLAFKLGAYRDAEQEFRKEVIDEYGRGFWDKGWSDSAPHA